MAESRAAAGSTVEESVPKRGATTVEWKWFGFKRSDEQQTVVVCRKCLTNNNKFISPPQAEARG